MNNESTIRSNSNMYNEGTKEKQLIHEIHNTARNLPYLVDQEGRLLPHVRDLDDEPKKAGAPAFVIGSGPSLDRSIEHLRAWTGGVLCTTSHAHTLLYYGIEPDYIVALDPFCEWGEIKGVDWSQTKTRLVTQPGVWPDLIANWPNDILLFLQNVGKADSFYATTQKYMFTRREGLREATFYPMIRTEVTLFACSPPCQLFVADRMGYGAIFLAGCDFGCPDGKERFTDYRPDPEKPGEWIRTEHPYVAGEDEILSNNGIPTLDINLYYKKNMISAWRLSLQSVTTTDHGTITEMPYEDIEDVVRKQGKRLTIIPKPERAERAEQYLASVGAFVIESEEGLSFVESTDPEKELLNYMQQVSRFYRCTQCDIKGNAVDDADHSGEICNRCGGQIAKVAHIDIDANMRRIRKLLANVERSKETVTGEEAEKRYMQWAERRKWKQEVAGAAEGDPDYQEAIREVDDLLASSRTAL